jgi:IS5 family transposase
LRFVHLLTINPNGPKMRKRFEPQLILGQLPISETPIPSKSRDSLAALVTALREIYITPEWNEKIFKILEYRIIGNKQKTGRPGMDLWQIFVLAQVRLCLNTSYDRLHMMANYDSLIRQLMGVETGFGYEKIEFEYQNILDNVSLLDDETVKELNNIIVEFGHDVFKKKEAAALRLKTDSFVVESNVHFPTDYNLLWDCARKCLDTVSFFLEKHPDITGWRKINNWYSASKSMMRDLGKATSCGGKHKEKRVKDAARVYLQKAHALLHKVETSQKELPLTDTIDLAQHINLDRFAELLRKHINLVYRRLINGESIPHEEKMFSIFETYTEWITKGKLHPNVELGKRTVITTDQYGLIVDSRVMENESDPEIVLPLAISILEQHKVESWSFDKGFWNKDNKSLLKGEVKQLIMPKKGKRNQEEEAEETSRGFIRLRNKHSAIESNINELGHRGLDRCPDRGYEHFKRYIGLAVCAYNLKRIGKRLIEDARVAQKKAA